MSLAFLITSFVVVVTPGTGVLYTLATALSRGYRASVIAAFGCTLGIVPQMAAAIVGVAALLNASALAFQAVKYLGVAYLVYLAWSTIRQHGTLELSSEAARGPALRVIVTAVLINVLNPKLSLFFFAFLPQFIAPHEAGAIAHLLALSAVFMAMTFVVFVAYGILASAARDWIVTRPSVMAWMRRAFAGVFVVFAARLALAQR